MGGSVDQGSAAPAGVVDYVALVRVLFDMDRQQQQTIRNGDREIAWIYYKGDVEKALGFGPGELFPEPEDDDE